MEIREADVEEDIWRVRVECRRLKEVEKIQFHLHQLVVDTIEATRERLLPLYMEAEQDKSITKKEVAERLGVCETTVYNMTKRICR